MLENVALKITKTMIWFFKGLAISTAEQSSTQFTKR